MDDLVMITLDAEEQKMKGKFKTSNPKATLNPNLGFYINPKARVQGLGLTLSKPYHLGFRFPPSLFN